VSRPWTDGGPLPNGVIEWQVAGACNYDCSYCIQSPRFRRGRPVAESLDAAVDCFAALPGTWEIKCSGGEAFAHPLFMGRVVPRLMDDTPHAISVLTNLSAERRTLFSFVQRTRGRLRVLSASLHLESVDPAHFVDKARWVQDLLDPDSRMVINQVVLPGREAEALACRRLVEDAGVAWFPQLYKHKRPRAERVAGGDPMTVATYPDADALRAVLGDRPGPREANLAPSYRGRPCLSGVRYFVVDKDGDAWACRSARRHQQGFLGSVFRGELRLADAPRACPYDICPCTVPANRGMIGERGPHRSTESRRTDAPVVGGHPRHAPPEPP